MRAHPLADSAPSGEEFTAWLTASCHQQGVPLTIRDRGVITQVAALLGTPAERRSRHTKPARTTTQKPTAAQLPNEPAPAERAFAVALMEDSGPPTPELTRPRSCREQRNATLRPTTPNETVSMPKGEDMRVLRRRLVR